MPILQKTVIPQHYSGNNGNDTSIEPEYLCYSSIAMNLIRAVIQQGEIRVTTEGSKMV